MPYNAVSAVNCPISAGILVRELLDNFLRDDGNRVSYCVELLC